MPEIKNREWMLTEEKIRDINIKTDRTMSECANVSEGHFTDLDMLNLYYEGEFAKCKAQARKIVEWLDEPCPHGTLAADTSRADRGECPECREQLRKEVGIDG